MTTPAVKFVSVWRVTPDFTRAPAGRIIMDMSTGAVTVEAPDATSKRLLDGFLSRGAVGYDLARRFPSDGGKFLDAVKAELAFKAREKSGGVRCWGGREGRWTFSAFPLMWVNPRPCPAGACRPRTEQDRRPVQEPPRIGGRTGSEK